MKQVRACPHCEEEFVLWDLIQEQYTGLRIHVAGQVKGNMPVERSYEVLCKKCGEPVIVPSSDLVADEELREEMWKKIMDCGPLIMRAAEKLKERHVVAEIHTERGPSWLSSSLQKIWRKK